MDRVEWKSGPDERYRGRAETEIDFELAWFSQIVFFKYKFIRIIASPYTLELRAAQLFSLFLLRMIHTLWHFIGPSPLYAQRYRINLHGTRKYRNFRLPASGREKEELMLMRARSKYRGCQFYQVEVEMDFTAVASVRAKVPSIWK